MSDYFRSRRSARKNRTQPLFPEDRFWVSQLGFPLVIAGLTIFLVRMAEATESKPPALEYCADHRSRNSSLWGSDCDNSYYHL